MFLDSTLVHRPVPTAVRRFWKVSGRSNLKRTVREIYFREDIGCGLDACKRCVKSAVQGALDSKRPLLVLTTDVFMKHLDVCDRFLANVVVPVTVSNEVRRRSLSVYGNLKKLLTRSEFGGFYLFSNENFRETYVDELPGESVSDRDARAVYGCARWYSKHLPEAQVFLVTLPNAPLHANEGAGDVDMDPAPNLRVVDLYELHELFPALFEGMLEHLPARTAERAAPAGERGVYPPHLSEAEIQEGLERAQLFVGTLHMYIGSYQRGYVACGKEEFKVSSLLHLNRALDNDRVAVELVSAEPDRPEDEGPAARSPEDAVGTESADAELVDGHMQPEQYRPRKRECRVVGIVSRARRLFCGSLLPVDNVRLEGYTERLFVPVDPRIPFVSIETRRSRELDGKRIVVAVDGWDRFARRPHGHWTLVLGDIDDRDVESEVILREHDVITDDFSLSAYGELAEATGRLAKPKSPKRTAAEMEDTEMAGDAGEATDIAVTPELLAGRTDYRNELVYSVDPPGCRDIDDALGCKRLANGNFEVSVHIADVTHFVAENSSLDREAAERCTTVYLVDRRTDMLPKLLTTDLCSLMENVNRLAFSVFWEMGPDGLVLSTRFAKSVIRSRRALTYQQAQAMIDSDSRWVRAHRRDDVAASLRSLNGLAKILRRQRMARGAVELESAEVKFEFDAERVTDLESYRVYDTNHMVRARAASGRGVHAAREYLGRDQDLREVSAARAAPRPPAADRGEAERPQPHAASARRRRLQVGPAHAQVRQLEAAEPVARGYRRREERALSLGHQDPRDAHHVPGRLRAPQAVYRNSADLGEGEFRHYGLCCEFYTHFTSPIRRYADVVVHRLLAAALGLAPLGPALAASVGAAHAQLSAQCDALNRRHRNAQWCGRDSDKMFSYLYFKRAVGRAHAQGGVEATATVLDISEDRLVVLTHKFGIEAVASVAPAAFDKASKTLVDAAGRRFRVFDEVRVRLFASNRHFRNTIRAEIVAAC